MLDDEHLAELESLARAATPGAWRWDETGDLASDLPTMRRCRYSCTWTDDDGASRRGGEHEHPERRAVLSPVAGNDYSAWIDSTPEDGAYIAALSPDVIATLVAEIKRLRGMVQYARNDAAGDRAAEERRDAPAPTVGVGAGVREDDS